MKINNKKILSILFFTMLLDMIGVGMIIPIIPIIFTDQTSSYFILQGFTSNMQYIIAGMITAISGIMTFIASPILGELSDLYGRRKILITCVAILAISQLFFALGILVSSLSLLFVSRIIAGLSGANISIAQASIADITEPKNRAKNFGLIGVAVGLGFIFGPFLGGMITAFTKSASLPFFIAGILGFINFIFIFLYLKETHKIPESKKHNITIFKALNNIKTAFTEKDMSTIYTSSFLYLTGFTFFTSFTGIFLTQKFGIDAKGLGTYFGAIGIWIVITQGFILRIITKIYNEKQILRYSLIFVSIAISLMPFMPSMFCIYFLLPFIAIPQGLSMANMSALISKNVSPEKQGTALGINSSLSSLAQGTIPALSGAVTAILGISFPYFIAGICIIFAWKNLFMKNKSIF